MLEIDLLNPIPNPTYSQQNSPPSPYSNSPHPFNNPSSPRNMFSKTTIPPLPSGFSYPKQMSPTADSSSTIPIKKLTPKEIVRKEKYLCYNCNETYNFGHFCK